MLSVSISIIFLRMCQVTSIIDTCGGLNLMRVDALDQSWPDNIRQRRMPEIPSTSDSRLVVYRSISFHLRMEESRTRATICSMDKLPVPVILETTFIDKLLKSIRPAERNLLRYHFPPEPILMVQGA